MGFPVLRVTNDPFADPEGRVELALSKIVARAAPGPGHGGPETATGGVGLAKP